MEPLWHNRRLQRSAAFAFTFITLALILMWTRDSWPAIPQTFNSPGDKGASHEKVSSAPEEPLYNAAKPEFDPAHMPAIPTVVANTGAAVNTAASGQGATAAHTPAAQAYINPALDPKRVALLIETRPASVLPALLIHMISVLPPQWVVKMVGTNESFAPVHQSRALGHHIKSNKLQLVDLPDHYPMTNQETVSQTLTNITFYRDFMAPAEWILMFQTDSIMCAASEQSVDDWVDKDYAWVGAPWYGDVRGGNGGLSLRNVSAIVQLLEKEERPPGYRQWEDMWLSEKLDKSAAIGADEVAFSVESMYYEKPLGYHLRGSGTLLDATVWGNGTRKRQILEYCPEVKIVLGNMQMPKKSQAEELLEEQVLDENVLRKEQGLPELLTPKQSLALKAEHSSKARENSAEATAEAVVTRVASTPEESAAANAQAEAAALAEAADLSPEHNEAYLAKEAEASQLMDAAAAQHSTESGPGVTDGSMTAQPLAPTGLPLGGIVSGGVKAVEKPVDPLTAVPAETLESESGGKADVPPAAKALLMESGKPSQQGVKEVEGKGGELEKGGYQVHE